MRLNDDRDASMAISHCHDPYNSDVARHCGFCRCWALPSWPVCRTHYGVARALPWFRVTGAGARARTPTRTHTHTHTCTHTHTHTHTRQAASAPSSRAMRTSMKRPPEASRGRRSGGSRSRCIVDVQIIICVYRSSCFGTRVTRHGESRDGQRARAQTRKSAGQAMCADRACSPDRAVYVHMMHHVCP